MSIPAAYTTTRTGWTDVGAPTVTARYVIEGHVCFFEIKVVPATTVATVAGTSYVSLPYPASPSAIGGQCSMDDLTALVSLGGGTIDVANGRAYVPTKTATGDTLLISGWYPI